MSFLISRVVLPRRLLTIDRLRRVVSLKIFSAHCFSAAEREASAVRTSMTSPNAVWAKHIIHLLDDFTIRGPNGTHKVHVTDVVMPMKQLLRSRLSAVKKKELVKGLAQGLAHLHRCGIIHGGTVSREVLIILPLIVSKQTYTGATSAAQCPRAS